jgi:hypothetical protein
MSAPIDLKSLLAQLKSSDNTGKVEAAEKIGQMGTSAREISGKLWDAFDIEPDKQVRSSLVKAILATTSEKDVIEGLIQRIQDVDNPQTINAIEALAKIGPNAQSALDPLFDLLVNTDKPDLQRILSRALINIETNKTDLLSKIKRHLQVPSVSLYLFFYELDHFGLPECDRQSVLADLWGALEVVDPTNIGHLLASILRLTRDPEHFFNQFIQNQNLKPAQKSLIFSLPYYFENGAAVLKHWWEKKPEPLLDFALAGLKDQLAVAPSSEFLAFVSQSIAEEVRERVILALEDCVRTYGLGLEALSAIGGIERLRSFISNSSGPNKVIGDYLIKNQAVLDQLWQKDQNTKDAVLKFLLPLLQETKDIDSSSAADVADWLQRNAETIPDNNYSAVIKELQVSDNDQPATRTKKDAALIEIRQNERRTLQKPLFAALDKGDADSQSEAVQKILQLQLREVTRDLVNKWICWVARGDRPSLTETTAEHLRMSPQAVLPLVDQVAKRLELDDDSKTEILLKLPPYCCKLTSSLYPNLLKDVKGILVEEGSRESFLASLEGRLTNIKHLKAQATAMNWDLDTTIGKIVVELFDEEITKREVKVRRCVLKLLADMSDERFFDRKSDHDRMKKELSKHAIPAMAARLPKETDIELRESLARLLGNVGGREAIDALVWALVSDERARANRQELLARYYLEPSKQRSEEASKILSDAVIDARQTLVVLRYLNIVVFIVGILLLVIGTITALTSDELTTRLLGMLAGVGGLAGVLVEMIKNPLDRIQNAMADLVQIETAFTGFIWELNLNGTFIQSQYVTEGVLTDDEIGQTVKRIEDAMTLALDKVAVYTKVGQQRVISRIYDLTPAAGPPSSMVTIHGQHLAGDKTEKKEDTGILAIDHKPVRAENLEWKDQKVSFKLPNGFNGDEAFDGTIWISLLVDGMETNALPFNVIAVGR